MAVNAKYVTWTQQNVNKKYIYIQKTIDYALSRCGYTILNVFMS